MSPRSRSPRANRLPRRRTLRPRLEDLEIRLTLSGMPPSATSGIENLLPPGSLTVGGGVGHLTNPGTPAPGYSPSLVVYHAPGTFPQGVSPGPNGILPINNGSVAPPSGAYGPQVLRTAYGVDNIGFGAVAGDGTGMTVAIVDAYDNPALVDTGSPGWANSDLATYDAYYGLPDPPSLSKVGQDGSTTLAPASTSWAAEEALDVEMVHAMAPMANIVLVEANDPSNTNMFTAEATAAKLAPVVTNSWGQPEFQGEQALDPTLQVNGVTFLFSTGDSGAPVEYPAASPYVVAVGGTSLYTNPASPSMYETGWSTTALLGGRGGGGTGGGTSLYEPAPAYQAGVQDTGNRTTPDVSSNADPATGVAVYDSYVNGPFAPWMTVGGTSEACPTWAGLVAIADQGRALAGGSPLTGYNQTLPALYGLPYTDFHDVTVGTNQSTSIFDIFYRGVDDPGYKAKAGYDEVTGLGTPKADALIPDLSAYGQGSRAAMVVQPPASVVAGDGFGLTVGVVDSLGNVDTNAGGLAIISRTAGPPGAPFVPMTAPVVGGLAVFDRLGLGTIGAGYQFTVTVGGYSVQTNTIGVIPDPTPGTAGTYYPAATGADLRSAILAADSNAFASNTIDLEAGTYRLTNAAIGQLVIQDAAAGVPNKTLTIVGAGAGKTIITPSQAAGFADRVFEVLGKPGAGVSVVFKDLTITGGYASGGGALGGSAALGGGVLVDGGTVSMTNVDLVGNVAGGSVGAAGGDGQRGQAGGAGAAGGAARGGAVYVAGGKLVLNNTVIANDFAWGGAGGWGGQGGAAKASGGAGGAGGAASGAGGYVASGSVSGSGNLLRSNMALGGRGGSGGVGGVGNTSGAGTGGAGGIGGGAAGGGLFVASGSVSLKATSSKETFALGGQGGFGGQGGYSKSLASNVSSIKIFLNAGAGGSGGGVAGAGVFLQGGALSLVGGGDVTVDRGLGGAYNYNGNYIFSSSSSLVSHGRTGVSNGGGIYVGGGNLTIGGLVVSHDRADAGGAMLIAAGGAVAGQVVSLTDDVARTGGAVLNRGSFWLDVGAIVSNSAATGGGIYNRGRLQLIMADVLSNAATAGRGGGIYSASGHITASSLTVSGNAAPRGGGGIYSARGALSIDGGTIADNTVSATGPGASATVGSGGGLDVRSGAVKLTGVTLSGNSARVGGGLYLSAGTATLTNTDLRSNLARQNGGGLYNKAATVQVAGGTLSGNTADVSGGALFTAGSSTLSGGSVISQNTATADGGGIYAGSGGQVKATGLQVIGNVARQGNGGGIFDERGSLSIFGGEVASNSAPANEAGVAVGWGGGVYDTGGKVTLSNTPVQQNAASNGAGLYVTSGSVTLRNEQLDHNTAAQAGGAIWNLGTLALDTSILTRNVAAQQGGGGIENTGKLTITNSTFSLNAAGTTGGDLDIGAAGNAAIGQSTITTGSAATGGDVANAGGLTIATSTLAFGSASVAGGGLANLASGAARLANATIAANTSAGDGGGVDSRGTMTVVNATIAYNEAGGLGVDLNVGGGTTSMVNTIVDLDSNGVNSPNDLAGTLPASSSNNLIGAANPGLGALSSNGGLTQTIPLLQGSPALDAGSNALALDPTTGKPMGTDQRGALRGALGLNAGGAVDIGAFEASSSYMVTATADSPSVAGTLRSALDWAAGSSNDNAANISGPAKDAPNTVVFDVGGTFAVPQTIALTSALPALVSKVDPAIGTIPIAIQGPGGGIVTVSGGRKFQVFAVASDTAVILQGITVAGGSAVQGGGVGNLGTLTLDNTVLMASTATMGGGIYSSGSLRVLDGSTIEDNTAGTGGGVFVDAGTGTVAIADAAFLGNTAGSGGGLYVLSGGLTLTNGTFTENAATVGGGGLAALGTVGTTITGGSFAGNSAPTGGGIEVVGGDAAITGATLSGNTATGGPGVGYGGALVFNTPGETLNAGALNLSNNAAAAGGAIYNLAGTLNLTDSTVANNAANVGGGIGNAGTLSVSATTLGGNTAAASGGGIASAGTLTVDGSTLSGNSAAQGGGIADTNGQADLIVNATLAGNQAAGGGAIYASSSALSLVNTTIAYNTASAGGAGGLDVEAGSVAVYNTIIDLNTSGGSTDVVGPTTGSNNLISVAGPGLAAGLADNGGPTQTIALLAGSVAIDHGVQVPGVPTTDQRGALRGAAAGGGLNAGLSVDVGAFEASSEYRVTQVADTNDLSTFRTAVGWANVSTNANPANLAHPAPNTVDFDTTGAFAAPQTIALSSALGTVVLSNTMSAEAIAAPAGGVTLSGGGAVGVLRVNPGVTATLANLGITGGSAVAGAGISNAGTLAIAGGTVSANSASGSGGGISNTGQLTLSGTILQGNTAAASGGGIYDPGTLTLTSALLAGNSAANGGGVAVAGKMTDTGSAYTGNTATIGGGLAVLEGATASLVGSTVAGNIAGTARSPGAGGGIDNVGTLSLFGVVVGQANGGNVSTGKGGGIANEQGGTLTTSYSTVANNSARATSGGGLDNAGAATVAVTTFSGNSAGTLGGGLHNEGGGTLILFDATLAGNTATAGGGGVGNVGTATVTNATVANNVGGKGAGVYDTGILTVNSATIAYNKATPGGTSAGLDAVAGQTTLYNTIVARNTTSTALASDAGGSLSPLSAYDLFGTGGSGGLSALNGIQVNVPNPGLGQLASTGGPTRTIPLLAGSPALDAGAASIPGDTTTAVDQRGALRGASGLNAGADPDIGAYEASSSYQVDTTADTTLMGTLRSAIGWADASTNANPANLAHPAPNTAAFDTAGAFARPQTITLLAPIELKDLSKAGEAIDGTASRGLTISGGGASQLFAIGAGAAATLTGLAITGGSSTTSGGAIRNAGKLTISNSTLSGNRAAMGGGAVDDLGTLSLVSTTLAGNSAGQYGGAVDVETGGALSATNATFSGNAAAHGGGVYSTGELTATNATIAYNTTTTSASGGGLDAAGGTSLLYNTIVASNMYVAGNGAAADDIAGFVFPLSADNLIGRGGSGGLVNGVNGNIVLSGNQSAGLAPGLGSNGGPTQTIALAPTSPAIGTGVAIAGGQAVVFDQRGTLRNSPTVDIGAFESSSRYLVTTAQDSTAPGTLRSAIAWADAVNGVASSVPLIIEFDTARAFSTPQVIDLALGTLAMTNTSRPIIIQGPGAASVTIDANFASGVFSVAPGVAAGFNGLTISGGLAEAGAGIDNAGYAALSGVAFTGNATPSGSGAAINNTGTIAVSNSTFSFNVGSYYGGAIYNHDGTATIVNSGFDSNSTAYGLGGAIDNLGGTLTVSGSTFRGNSSFQGGAIFNRNDATTGLAGVATLYADTIEGNVAYQGGGLFNEGTLAASSDTLAFNVAFQGGALSNNFGGATTLTDSTLAFNTAQQYGGAIDTVSGLAILVSTIAYNTVADGGTGGGIDIYGGTTSLYDSIVALNTMAAAAGPGSQAAGVANDITGLASTASADNLVGSGGSGGLTNGVNANLVGVIDPGLAPSLASNGGPTQTIALSNNSPALGAGSGIIGGVAIPTVDQRGVARPLVGFDLGAYQGTTPAPPSTTTPTPSPSPAAPALPAAAVPVISIAAATSNPVPAPAAPALITGPAPFRGRKLHGRGHRPAKVSHSGALASHAVHTTPSARRGLNIPMARHKNH